MQIINVIPTNDYKLILQYSNNEVRIYDVKPLLEKGIFKILKDKKIFYTVRPRLDSVEWPNIFDDPYCSEIDISPESLYTNSVLYE